MHASIPHVCLVSHAGQKRALDSCKLELQVVVSTMWMLGHETGSPGRAVSALNH